MYSDRHQQYNAQIPARRSRQYTTDARVPQVQQHQAQDVEEDDDRYYLPAQTQVPRSAQRYTTEGNPVVVQNGRRYVLHNEPPPARQRTRQPQRHWLLIFGCGMIVMIALFALVSWAVGAWQAHQLDAAYGMPRTFQVDAVVGHNGDSNEKPSHFIFENLHGKAIVIEIPAGDPSKAIIYIGPAVVAQDASSIPVTGKFENVNGKVEMLVTIENQTIVYTNNGTKFVPQQP